MTYNRSIAQPTNRQTTIQRKETDEDTKFLTTQQTNKAINQQTNKEQRADGPTNKLTNY
jgi:hypothetical protein